MARELGNMISQVFWVLIKRNYSKSSQANSLKLYNLILQKQLQPYGKTSGRSTPLLEVLILQMKTLLSFLKKLKAG